MTLEEVKNAERFVKNLEKIQLPNQLAAVLADPLLQKLLSLRKDDATSRRVKNWIESTLVDVLEGNTDTKGFEDVMEVIRDYVIRVKVRSVHVNGASCGESKEADIFRMFLMSYSTSSRSYSKRGTALMPRTQSSAFYLSQV